MEVVHLNFVCFSMLGRWNKSYITPILVHCIIINIQAKEQLESEMRFKSRGPKWNVVKMKIGLRKNRQAHGIQMGQSGVWKLVNSWN